MEHEVLRDSHRSAKAGAVRVGDVDPGEVIEATVTLAGPPLPEPGTSRASVLSREELAERMAAAEHTIETARRVFRRLGLEVSDESALTRSMHVSGTAARMEAAFAPRLGIYESREQGRFRGREGELSVPAELRGIVTGVFGLDERRMAHRGRATPAAAHTGEPLSIAVLAARYAFPQVDAKGITVGIAEFGGGYFASDLETFCKGQQLAVPDVAVVPVGLESLTEAEIMSLPEQMRDYELGCSEEVNMDVQIVAGMCPGAGIAVYFAPGSQKGWIDLLNAVIADHANDPRVLSVSWGAAEDTSDWAKGAVRAIDERLQAAALLGITVCVASGDDGSGDDQSTGAHVNFPASSPNVLAVGGTQLDASGDEVVWWESPGYRTGSGGGSTGGGISTVFGQPAWQTVPPIASLNERAKAGRIVPDIAALAGPPYYRLTFLGSASPNGGTSAAAPLVASLVGLLAAATAGHGRLPFFAPLLYAPGPDGSPRGSACTDITSGTNASLPDPGTGYEATPGFDAVSGWGSPQGAGLLAQLANLT